MNGFLSVGGVVLAQIVPGATPPPTAVPLVREIALKRWYATLTLSSPDALPNSFGFKAWLVGLVGLLVLAMLIQGPRRTLRQFLDLKGNAQLLAGGMSRLRRSGRLVAILLGATVIAWTTWQAPLHAKQELKDELGVLLKSKSRVEVATEQGELAALTPLRDLLGLGDSLLLLVGAGAIVFKFSADRWGRIELSDLEADSSLSGWTTLCWGGAGSYAMYRMASLIASPDGMSPLGGCLFVEAGVVPLLMLVADGLLLAWVLVELRRDSAGEEEDGFDVGGVVMLLPAASLACLLALPARYVATALGLALYHVSGVSGNLPVVSLFLKGWGLAELQAAAMLFLGLVGAAAWSRGSWSSALQVYFRTLRTEGGRLVAVVAAASLAAGGLSTIPYLLVLALPVQPWILNTADSYAHYATLPLGLLTLATLVELAGRTPWPAATSAKSIIIETAEPLAIRAV